MKTKLLNLKLLATLMACLTSALVANAYDIYTGGIYYNYIDGSSVEVTYQNDNYNSYSGDVTIPEHVTYDGVTYTVIGIGSNAFSDCSGLTSVSIPHTITYCENYAFAFCTALSNVYISDLSAWCRIDFENIYSNPMYYADELILNGYTIHSLVIPDDITTIKKYAFEYCRNLRSIIIRDGVTSIEQMAFFNDTNVESLSIGSGCEFLGANVFSGCINLTRITCHAFTPPSISENTFDPSCYSNAELFVPGSTYNDYKEADYWKDFSNIHAMYDFKVDNIFYRLINNYRAFVTYEDETTYAPCYWGDIVIPDSVTHNGKTYAVTGIDPWTFVNCDIPSIVLPTTLKFIDHKAFANCSTLTNITCLSLTPPTILSTVFDSESFSTAALTVPKNSATAYQADATWGQFATINAMTYDFNRDGIYYEVTGENEVKVTRENSSSYTFNIMMSIPASVNVAGITYDVTAIGTRAFHQCENLTTVNLPASVRDIGDYSFYHCSNLTTINLGNVYNIGSYSFASCTSLATVRLNGALENIQGTSFHNCSELTSYDHTFVEPLPWLKYEFVNGVIFTKNADDRTLVSYPCGKNLLTYTVPDGTVNIGDNAFYNNKYVKTVNMPTSLREIQNYAFSGCNKITNVEVPKGVTTIGRYAFSRCTSLANVILPSTLTSLGGATFNEDEALAYVGVKAQIPPVCDLAPARPNTLPPFDQSHFSSVTLGVPTGCKNFYKAANIWKLFTTIREYEQLVDVDFILGDVNGDGSVNIADVTTLIDLLLSGDTIDNPAADVNEDNSINIADVTALIDRLLNLN